MAASMQTRVYYGAASSADSANHIRFKNADDNTDDLNNPVQIPDAGSNYSWKKTVALYAGTAPATSITNVRVYMDGANNYGTGVTLVGKLVASYTQATDATPISGGFDMFSKTAASPQVLTGSIGATTGKGTLQFLELQLVVAAGANPGDLHAVAENLAWLYDEA